MEITNDVVKNNEMNDDEIHLDYECSQSEEEFLNCDLNLYDDILFESDDLAQTDQSDVDKLSNENVQRNPCTTDDQEKNTPSDAKTYQLYVGNLTWWTTDQCLADCLTSIGVLDLIDVDFFENQTSGQSEGFCVITLSSEQSIKLVQNKLPKQKLYGRSPVVTFVSREAYLMFSSKPNFRPSPLPIDEHTPETVDQVQRQYVGSDVPFASTQQPQQNIYLPPPLAEGTTTDSVHLGYYYDFLNTSTNPDRGDPHQILINPHLNTAYYQQPNNANESPPAPCAHNKTDMSAQKLKEILIRNRTVSSSAIARAITNVTDGEFSSAIETLATAIVLIKQSKIAKHESSKALVSCLDSVLHDVEKKRSYNSRKDIVSKSPRNKLHWKSQHRRFREYECRDASHEYNAEKHRFKHHGDYEYKNDKVVKRELSFSRRTK